MPVNIFEKILIFELKGSCLTRIAMVKTKSESQKSTNKNKMKAPVADDNFSNSQ